MCFPVLRFVRKRERERVRKECSLGREKTQHPTPAPAQPAAPAKQQNNQEARSSSGARERCLEEGRVAIRQYEYNEHKAWTSQVHKRTLKKQFPPRRPSPLLLSPLLSRLLLLLLVFCAGVYWCWCWHVCVFVCVKDGARKERGRGERRGMLTFFLPLWSFCPSLAAPCFLAPRSGVASPCPEPEPEPDLEPDAEAGFLSGVPGPGAADAGAGAEEAGAGAEGEALSRGEGCSVWVLAAVLTKLAHEVGFAAPAVAAAAAAAAGAAAESACGEAEAVDSFSAPA